MEKHEFQAESRRLLEMMIHSIYSQKEIFLRELISNASDAMDKLSYLSMTSKDVDVKMSDMDIQIRIDKDRRLLRIRDKGIGMNAEELEKNLGIIAKSDSREFQEAMAKDPKGGESLIGQFGVGFYSAFMVADRIAVLSKKYGDTQGYRWDSNGIDGFTIQPYDKKEYGTDIILRIRKDEEGSDEYSKYLREYTLYKLIKKYSDYIRYPIKLWMPHPEIKKGSPKDKPEFEEVFSYEIMNSMVPLWQRPKSEVKKEDQEAFYKEHFGEQTPPSRILTADVEGNVTYKALLYIPGKQPKEYGTDDFKAGLELYSSSVKIMDSCEELLPEEFNFVRGIVDSPDISLNISRELLQKNARLTGISANLTKKVRTELSRMLTQSREEYEKFHDQFGHHLKVCAMDDYGKKKDSLGEFLLFYSWREKKQVTLEEYISGMKEDQKYIYYVNGDSPEAVANVPQMEIVTKNGMDVLCFLDKADEFVARMFGNYKEKAFRSVLNEDLGLSAQEEGEQASPEAAELLTYIKETLGDQVDDVKASARLMSHPVCLTNGKGITFEMERYFRSISPDMPMKAKYILEVNTGHDALKKIDRLRSTDPDRAAKYCQVLYQQARLIAGLTIADPSGYTDLICSLW